VRRSRIASGFSEIFWENLENDVVTFVTPVPTVDGRWCPVGLRRRDARQFEFVIAWRGRLRVASETKFVCLMQPSAIPSSAVVDRPI